MPVSGADALLERVLDHSAMPMTGAANTSNHCEWLTPETLGRCWRLCAYKHMRL